MKLHLGCGRVHIPGMVHVDLADFKHIDYHADIGRLPMFEDNTVDYVYCCHALEYKNRCDGFMALREWHRVLKSEGVLRVAVPDFQAIVQLYCEKRYASGWSGASPEVHVSDEDVLLQRGFLGPLYGEMQVQPHFAGKQVLMPQTLYHKTVYDFPSLRTMLWTAGFRNIRRYDWRTTEHADVDDCSQAYIPHMDKEHGQLISLNVEATK